MEDKMELVRSLKVAFEISRLDTDYFILVIHRFHEGNVKIKYFIFQKLEIFRIYCSKIYVSRVLRAYFVVRICLNFFILHYIY